ERQEERHHPRKALARDEGLAGAPVVEEGLPQHAEARGDNDEPDIEGEIAGLRSALVPSRLVLDGAENDDDAGDERGAARRDFHGEAGDEASFVRRHGSPPLVRRSPLSLLSSERRRCFLPCGEAQGGRRCAPVTPHPQMLPTRAGGPDLRGADIATSQFTSQPSAAMTARPSSSLFLMKVWKSSPAKKRFDCDVRVMYSCHSGFSRTCFRRST